MQGMWTNQSASQYRAQRAQGTGQGQGKGVHQGRTREVRTYQGLVPKACARAITDGMPRLAALGLVCASAGFGCVYAWNVGSTYSVPLGILSVVMALGLEGVKPIAIAHAFEALGRFQVVRGLCLVVLGLVAVAYSLVAELSLVATTKSDIAAERTSKAQQAQSNTKTRERIEQELASIGVTRTTLEIEADLQGLLSDKRLNGCDGWLESTKLRTACIERVQPLRKELGRSERREALETELRKIGTQDNQSVGTSDPGAGALATYLGALGIRIAPETLAQWLLIVPVLALEVGSALALVLVHSTTRETRHETTPRTSLETRVLDHIRTSGGTIQASERSLALVLGCDRSTLRRAIQSLAKNGSIVLASEPRKATFISLTYDFT